MRSAAPACSVCELHAESTFKVEGMDCREEVAILERRFKNLKGLEDFSADVLGQRLHETPTATPAPHSKTSPNRPLNGGCLPFCRVNLAARLESIAEPGGICISEDAFRQVRGKIETDTQFYVLTSTNMATPISTWTRLSTNTFAAGGNFSVTNAIVSGDRQRFYLLQLP